MNEVIRQLNARTSLRAFSDRDISPEDKEAVLEAACMAPTAGNQQMYTMLREMFAPRSGPKGFEGWVKAFYERKYDSAFSREMSRSVAAFLEQFAR